MLEDLSWCQIHLYTQHSNIADKNYEKNGANFRDLGFLTIDVTSSFYYMYDWILMKKHRKNCKCWRVGDHRLEARLPDLEEQRYDSQKVEMPNLWRENRPGRHHVDLPPPLILTTILVHYYFVLPGKNIENFIMKHKDMIESGHSQGDIEARDI